MKFPNPASRYCDCGRLRRTAADGAPGRLFTARPASSGSGRWKAALAANWSADAVAGTGFLADGLNEDIHASAEYRAHLVTVMAKRAVAKAG